MTEARVPTADLVDEHGLDVQSCDTQFRSFGRHRAFQGTVVTVRCFEDNALLSAVADEPGDGRVIVVDAGGSLHAAVLGDQMAARAVASGWTGIIINGAVRDVAVLDTLRIGIKALGTNPRRSAKTGAGERDAIVTFGGAVFTPGWWLVSDEDGVVVLAPDLVAR